MCFNMVPLADNHMPLLLLGSVILPYFPVVHCAISDVSITK